MNKKYRMHVRPHVIPHWYRPTQTWNQLVVYKCVPEEHYVAIWLKYMRCIGDLIQGLFVILDNRKTKQ